MSSSQSRYRVKLALFVLCAIAILFLVDTAYQGLNTLSRLNIVEAERDHWQRPSEVIQALDLKPGNVVFDLGCGSGYFTLKLSTPVDQSGKSCGGGYPQAAAGIPVAPDAPKTRTQR